jgi:hypothetical protein
MINVHKTLAVVLLLICTTIISSRSSFAQSDAGSVQTTNGLSNFQFVDEKGNADKPIRVWFYKPQSYTAHSPVVFVMHGVARDAQRYCRDWIQYAQEHNFLLVCPEFDEQQYSADAYQRGNMFDDAKNPVPETKWTFTAIEHLFDYMKALTRNTSTSYYIYGHSAGAQFVHRFVLFMPYARYQRAIAANPGWYTMPIYTAHKFPYGLRESNLSEKSLKQSFGRDFRLLLGGDDLNADDPQLRKTVRAEDQGATRFARGQNYFKAAQSEASALGAQFNWQLNTVPGAHHSDAEMARAAASTFFMK